MVGKPQFQREEVLNAAMGLFALKGYHGTTTRDVQEHLGLHPGSVYKAFGGKHDLYKEVLKNYRDLVVADLDRAMAAHETVLGGFKAFFKQSLDTNQGHLPSSMCMVSMTLRDFEKNAEMSQFAQEVMSTIDPVFDHHIQRALDQNEFKKPDHMKSSLVHYIQIQLLGLRTAVSNGISDQERDQLIEDAFLIFETQ